MQNTSKRAKLYLYDILEAIEAIESYTKDIDYEEFANNRLIRHATIKELEIIGEAVKNIPKEIKDKYSRIPWRNIAGMRDILVHAYFKVDTAIVWGVIKERLPELKEQIEKILKDIEGDNENIK